MIGIDIVNINKFKETAKKDYFIKNIFTDDELSYVMAKQNINQTLAGIFAAKEAVIKAYSLNLSYILRKKIEIVYENNKPELILNKIPRSADISISHDGDYAIATCISNDIILKEIDKEMMDLFPERNQASHKGDYGRIGVLGGSSGMAGSVFMSSMSSLRTGAGLSYIIAPKSISDILQIKATEQIIKEIECDNFYFDKKVINQILESIKKLDVIIIGPGMGKGKYLNKLIDEVLKNIDMPVVIDADGLNAVSKDLSILKSGKSIILTPHLGEFSRLTNLSIGQINDNRLSIAKEFAKDNEIILVLKSENTIVTDGNNYYINKIGNAGMATAGSGDVLTGIIGTLTHRLDSYNAAKLGLYLHSLAGDIANRYLGEDALIATDIIKFLPIAIKKLRKL